MPAGGFDHNAHTLRILTKLESPYPRWPGLNLTWDMLEGLAKHNGPVRHPTWALVEADADFPLELGQWPSLEAQVAAIADDIAYDNHDIDDGLRAGILDLDALCGVPLVAERWRAVCDRHAEVPRPRLRQELVRDQIGVMVNDVIEETRRRIAGAGVETVDDVRAAGHQLVGFSDADGGGRAHAQALHVRDALPQPVAARRRRSGARATRRGCSRPMRRSRRCCPTNGARRYPRRSPSVPATSPTSSLA